MKASFSNKISGKFMLGLERSQANEVLPFPRQFNVDLRLDEIDEEIAVAACLLLFPHAGATAIEVSDIGSEFEDFVDRNTKYRIRTVGASRGEGLQREDQTQLLVTDIRLGKRPIQPEGRGRRVLVNLLDSSEWVGKLFTTDKVLFAANSSMFISSTVSVTEIRIAMGLLMLNDWHSRRLTVEVSDSITSQRRDYLVALCRALGVALELMSTDEVEELLYDER